MTRRQAANRPEELTPVRAELWPEDRYRSRSSVRLAIFQSKRFLVQVFSEPHLRVGEQHIGVTRITVNRLTTDKSGRWDAGIAWDDLQAIKSAVGFGDSQALEVYPADIDVVNVANMRHLWVLERPIALGWFHGVAESNKGVGP